jgi:hypothetical protein
MKDKDHLYVLGLCPPAPFDQGDNPRIGYISVDLRNPGTY